MKSKAFNITLPQELVQKIDEQAKKQYTSRSDYIRSVLVRQIDEADEWDEFFNKANAKGRALGITSEEQVYAMIDDYKKSQKHK